MLFNVSIKMENGELHTHQIHTDSLAEAKALFSKELSRGSYGPEQDMAICELYFADSTAIAEIMGSLITLVTFMGYGAAPAILNFVDWLYVNAPEHSILRWWQDLHNGDIIHTFKHVNFRYISRTVIDI